MLQPAPAVPRAITREIRAFCAEIVPNTEPRWVPVRPVSDGDVKDCFPVVARHVERMGGSTCIGWRLWELQHVFLEAEFHAVWRDPDGRLIDVTPVPTAIDRILFLADPSRTYEGRQVNNIRRALSDNPAIKDFFRAADDEFDLMNRGTRADKHGTLALHGPDKDEWLGAEARKSAAMLDIFRELPKPGRNDPCPCGSGKKFKKCHGG